MTGIVNYGCFNGAVSAIAGNVFGLGAVERQPVRWGNCAKPVLAAGGIIQH